MTIPIGIKGLILNPDVTEPYVLVQDDLDGTGGYYVLTCENPDFATGTGYDTWVLDVDLKDFFEASGWQIKWSQDVLK